MFFGGKGGDKNAVNIPIPKVETFFPQVDRIVAVGDVHGDVEALRGCLKIAKLIDDKDSWIGGNTHFVQVGDILDRGDEEKDCLNLLVKLRPQAEAKGGAVHILLGNHEVRVTPCCAPIPPLDCVLIEPVIPWLAHRARGCVWQWIVRLG